MVQGALLVSRFTIGIWSDTLRKGQETRADARPQ